MLICGGARGVVDTDTDADADADSVGDSVSMNGGELEEKGAGDEDFVEWKLEWDESNVPESWVRKGWYYSLSYQTIRFHR